MRPSIRKWTLFRVFRVFRGSDASSGGDCSARKAPVPSSAAGLAPFMNKLLLRGPIQRGIVPALLALFALGNAASAGSRVEPATEVAIYPEPDTVNGPKYLEAVRAVFAKGKSPELCTLGLRRCSADDSLTP